MEFHELANIFPLDEEHLDELVEDIRALGQIIPIDVYEGKILDGRRRWLACKKLEIAPKTRVLDTCDPLAYVVSLNLRRRQLTESQAAILIIKINSYRRAHDTHVEDAKERHKTLSGRPSENKPRARGPGVSEPRRARDDDAKLLNVSGRTIQRAIDVGKKGVLEVIDAVEKGSLSLRKAEEIVRQPKEEQPEALQKVLEPEPKKETPEKKLGNGSKTGMLGMGVVRANEAINCLKRIPKNDALRKRGFQIVRDWMKHNP